MRKVTEKDNYKLIAKLLNESFSAVAEEFNITRENCPSHNAFIEWETLYNKMNSNTEFYLLESSGYFIGFIAIEKSKKEKGTFYIEKVAIHPDYRHKGKGKQIMEFAEKRIKELDGKRISVGLINENVRLKDWYKSLGYSETGVKVFGHLPFDVCYMGKELK